MEVEVKLKNQDFIVETPVIVEEKINNSEMTRKYERGKYLGKGGFAKCYEMKSIDTNQIYAAKVFEKISLSNNKSRKKLINEIKLHKNLIHKNIVSFEHFFEDKDHVYILLELCSNQTLNDLLKRRKRLTEIEVQCYVIQIVKALKYIHTHQIIHRDVKLGNCFLTNKMELKLGDFGLAAKLEFEGQRRRTVCGTPNYIAPEILEKNNGHSFEVDVWSLGVLAYALLFGRSPFESDDVKLTYKKIKMNCYTFPDNIKVHPTAKKFISSILNLDPSKRLTLDQILEHEFFKIYNCIPVVMPLSTLACPPSQNFIGLNLKNEYRSAPRKNSVKLDRQSNRIISILNSNDEDGYNKSLKEIKNSSVDLLKQIWVNEGDERERKKFENLNDLEYKKFYEKIKSKLVKTNRPTSRNYNHINNDEQFNSINFEIDRNDEVKIESNASNNDALLNYFIHNAENIPYMSNSKIKKYFDYSQKFGIVYYLNNYVGICFNDNSNILFDMLIRRKDNSSEIQENPKYLYIDKEDYHKITTYDENNLDEILNSKNRHKDLTKKLEIFKRILKKYSEDFYKENDLIDVDDNNFKNINNFIFIKTFLKVQNAIMFRLSNKSIHFFFIDKSQLVLSTDHDNFFYSSKTGEVIRDNIHNTQFSDDSYEVIKRIKYAKNMLVYYVKNQKSKNNFVFN